MGKNKFKRFQENLTFSNLIQPEFDEIFHKDHHLKGQWRERFFKNDNPIVLELGCGRGEYTIAMAEAEADKNFIGIDIKGARLWRGAKTATESKMGNVGFLRTRIEFINSFFATNEVDQVWITFPDPQLKKDRVKKRLVAPEFLSYYSQFVKPNAVMHLKTDSQHLHDYTKAVIEENNLTCLASNNDIYGSNYADETLSIKTTYEAQFLEQGLAITYLCFTLNGRDEFSAPYFEPDESL